MSKGKRRFKFLCLMSIVISLTLGVYCSIKSAYNQAYLSVYITSLRNLSDKDLVKNYQQELAALQRGDNTRLMTTEEQQGTQLPIMKISELKAIVNEIKQRIKGGKFNLTTQSEIEKTEKLISAKEAEMKKGGKQ
jgi:hypothetical protein